MASGINLWSWWNHLENFAHLHSVSLPGEFHYVKICFFYIFLHPNFGFLGHEPWRICRVSFFRSLDLVLTLDVATLWTRNSGWRWKLWSDGAAWEHRNKLIKPHSSTMRIATNSCLCPFLVCLCFIQRCSSVSHHTPAKVPTKNQTKLANGETEVHHRPKRGWIWNQFFVLEEHTGLDPQYVGKVGVFISKQCNSQTLFFVVACYSWTCLCLNMSCFPISFLALFLVHLIIEVLNVH